MDRADTVISLLDKIVSGPNKAFMCDIYSYLWDLVSILKICKAYVQWLGILSYIEFINRFFLKIILKNIFSKMKREDKKKNYFFLKIKNETDSIFKIGNIFC